MQHDTIEASHGRWREILPAIGLDPKFLTKKQGPCPMCAGTDRFTFSDRNGDGDYLCRQCGAGKGLRLVQAVKGWDFKTAAHEVDQIIGNLPKNAPRTRPPLPKPVSIRELKRIWGASLPIMPDNPVGLYLARRGIHLQLAVMLRFVPEMYHAPTKTTHPAMIAVVRDTNGDGDQLHRTYLTPDGHKADVEPVRMFMARPMPEGGAIRLGPEKLTMGIAEGIETALSATMLFNVNTWATATAGELEKWEPPSLARTIMIFGDNDHSFTGQAAAYALAKRLVNRGLDVSVHIPAKTGEDWNDELQRSKPNGHA